MSSINMSALYEVIKEKYKSFQRPEFYFVAKAISIQPYRDTVKKLESFFEVNEITDPNDDVSFRYILRSGNQEWVVELSMVGVFAIIFRIRDQGFVDIIDSDPTEEDEIIISEILSEADLQFFSKEELEAPIDMRLFNTNHGNVRVYQVLFSDTDMLPWE